MKTEELPIRQRLCPPERYGVKCPYPRTPRFIVVHNTGNDAPAENEVSYMLRRPEEVSFHFAVDEKEAVQALPLDRNAWASGDGRGPGNLYGIHVEICWSLSGGERFQVAEDNGARLIARLLKQYGWGLEQVTKHQDYDGKYCPHRTLDLGWQRFLRKIQEYKEYQEESMSYEEFRTYMERYEREKERAEASSWAKEAWSWAKEQGWMNGKSPRAALTREQAALVLWRVLNPEDRT